MRKIFEKLLALFLFFGVTFAPALAAVQKSAVKNKANAFQNEIRPQNLEKQTIKYSEPVKKLEGSLFIENKEEAQILITKQQESDVEDIENLWNATVDKNPIIKFSLKKLSIPEEQRRIHSSLMAKSLGALISGASMLPSFMGMNYGIQSASYAGARLANNFLNKENIDKLKSSPLTDTEVIELATLIEELQDDIVAAYYGYKGSLIRLKEVRGQLLLYNQNYSAALKNKDSLEIAVASALWDEIKIQELDAIEDVKKSQIILQRLAGRDTVENLKLVQYNINTQNIDFEGLDMSPKKINTDVRKEAEKIKTEDKKREGVK